MLFISRPFCLCYKDFFLYFALVNIYIKPETEVLGLRSPFLLGNIQPSRQKCFPCCCFLSFLLNAKFFTEQLHHFRFYLLPIILCCSHRWLQIYNFSSWVLSIDIIYCVFSLIVNILLLHSRVKIKDTIWMSLREE